MISYLKIQEVDDIPQKRWQTQTTRRIERFLQIHLTKLYRLEKEARGIKLDVNSNNTFICFKQVKTVSTLSGKSMKLVDVFIFLSSNISSIKSDVKIRLEKALTAMGRQSITWKSDLSNKIKHDFFQAVVVWYYFMDAPLGLSSSEWKKVLF